MQLAALIGGHVEKIDADTPLAEAAQRMVALNVGSLVVTSESGPRGIITEHDITRAAASRSNMATAEVDDWMTDLPHVARPEWTLEETADVMIEHDVRHLPIMDEGGALVGIASIKDLMWAMRGPGG